MRLRFEWGDFIFEVYAGKPAPIQIPRDVPDHVHSATDVRTQPYEGVYVDDKQVDLQFGYAPRRSI